MENLYDLIIVGAGPAGLSAAIYMARAKYRVLVLEKDKIGGQITITSEVVNYPGVFQTSGSQLTKTMHEQALDFGAEFQFAQVTAVETGDNVKKIITNKGEFQALSVIFAMGANPRKLGFEGEEAFQGRGVAYCATCDGEFFKGMEVYVVGGGFAAVEEGIFLTKYASHVHIIVRKDSFSCAKTVADKALNHPKITVHFHTEVEKVEGGDTVNSITLIKGEQKETVKITPENGMGVFVFAGYVPNTQWVPSEIATDKGYILTDDLGQTNVQGIFAAGDLRVKELRQVVTATSDGATAATALEKYVENLHEVLNLPEFLGAEREKKPVSVSSGENQVADGVFITGELASQLCPVLEQFTSKVALKAVLAQDDLAEEMEVFVREWSQLSDNISCTFEKTAENHSYIELLREDGVSAGIRYHAIPSGHEFNSFFAGIYQLLGGKPLDSALVQRISQLKPFKLQVFITLSCSMCPDVVQACQRLAMENENLNTEILDIGHLPELREKYKIMSVPCLVVNEEKVHFGKKQLEEIIEILEKSPNN